MHLYPFRQTIDSAVRLSDVVGYLALVEEGGHTFVTVPLFHPAANKLQ
jgi:hypothetical protein